MSDLRIDPERAQWLRALRSMNDEFVLRLLDAHTRHMQQDAWDEGFNEGCHFADADRSHATYKAEPPSNPYREGDHAH